MSARDYEFYKAKYAKTKPIRGRSPEVRPIGERRRIHEEIVRHEFDDGTSDPNYSYAARLYNTDVVEYFPSGDIIVRTGGWQTPSTADFIHEHSPFACWKQYNKLWVRCRNKEGEVLSYPVGNELHMKHTGDRSYEPATPVMIQKKVVDRAKAKEVRAPMQPFLRWAKTFLTMSDGWVMHETCKQAMGWRTEPVPGYANNFLSERSLYDMLVEPQGEIEPEGTYLYVMCVVARAHVGHIDKRIVESHSRYVNPDGSPSAYKQHFLDVQIGYDAVRDLLYRWSRKFADVDKIVEVEPTSKAITRTA